MSDEEKLEAAQRRKEKGNAQFKAGKWAAALAKYKVGTATALQHIDLASFAEQQLCWYRRHAIPRPSMPGVASGSR